MARVTSWTDAEDLDQGAEVHATVADPVARRQFLADFGLDELDGKMDALMEEVVAYVSKIDSTNLGRSNL